MKDLDFDELDKAVNSLMAGVSKTPASTNGQQSAQTPPSPVQTPPAVKSASVSASPTASRVTSRLGSSASAPRRGGRFMDVVHPSAAKNSDTIKPVSRQAATVEPTGPLAPPKVESTPPEVPSPDHDSMPKSDWPDPLDMPSQNAEVKETKKPSSETLSSAAAAVPSPVAETPPSASQPQPLETPSKEASEVPLTTPFLPDTKVEKRPLGANASAAAPTKDEADDSEEKGVFTPDEASAQLPAAPEDVKPLLPEELHHDLVAIESDTTEPIVPEEDTNQAPIAVNSQKTLATPPKEKASLSPSSAGPASIPQQYREEPGSSDQKNGAIYDTETYHKPLSHPAKQKSGWMWVIWIILILLVGAGGGAAFYFLGFYKF